jgi:sporulation protein YlmC with PRC-barrel domain
MARILLALALLPGLAAAADILDARYDPAVDALVVDIAYRGTRDGHDFKLRWGPCRHGNIAARLVDRQGHEAAREDFRVTARFPLQELECRPANITVRLGRVSHTTVFVPAREAAAVPKPWLDVRASELLGRPVTNALGEDLGDIADVVVDLPGEEVRRVLLRFRAEREMFAFPITAFAPVIGGERLLLTVDRASLLARGGVEPQLQPGEASVSRLMRGNVRDLVLNFSTDRVRAAILDSGELVPLAAAASPAGAGGTRAEPSERAGNRR